MGIRVEQTDCDIKAGVNALRLVLAVIYLA